MTSNTTTNRNRSEVDWTRYGLGNDNAPQFTRTRTSRTGGFVDLGNEYEYAAGGHQSSGPNEIFEDEQGDRPWWRSNFFISQRVLFGTWDGVFTSCLINVFGVIVFLRSGWIVAQAGVINAILIVLATVSIALISVLSAVGICERCRVESGGVYFLLAHTLGTRFGASLGLIYCFGQAVGCALNVLGFGESLAGLFGITNSWAIRGFAAGAVLLLGIINIAGVKWVIKLQFALSIVLLLSALDFMVGSFIGEDPEHGFDGWLSDNMGKNLWADYQSGITWFTVFGVFFPTVTGILSGINMSGDLRAPSTDIPNGTLAAFATSTFLYLVFILFLGATCQRLTLMKDYMIVVKVSAVQFLLVAGIYVSSMSSCLGAMYGTPRVLQSIANENVIPGIGKLGAGRGPNKIPLYSMTVVAFLTICFILIGDINTLAPIVTMPFLLTYACIDYSYFALAQTFDIQNRREERFRIQAQSPSYETRRYGTTTQEYNENNDLDQLFPERVRHKNLTTQISQTTPLHVPTSNPPRTSTTTTETTAEHSNSNADRVTFRDGTNTIDGIDDINVAEDEPIVPIRTPIHSKTKNWYSGFCNRWASLVGAGIKILIMLLVNWVYAIIAILLLFVIWFYVGTANPAHCSVGLAHEFRFFIWMKSLIFRCFGKRVNDYEQIVVTSTCPDVNLTQQLMNEENDDFSSRRRYHQTSMVQGHYVDDI